MIILRIRRQLNIGLISGESWQVCIGPEQKMGSLWHTYPSTKIGSLDTRLYYDFTLLYIKACTYTIPILDRDLWPTVGHLVRTISTRWRLVLIVYNWPPSIPQCHLSTKEDIKIWPGRQATRLAASDTPTDDVPWPKYEIRSTPASVWPPRSCSTVIVKTYLIHHRWPFNVGEAHTIDNVGKLDGLIQRW